MSRVGKILFAVVLSCLLIPLNLVGWWSVGMIVVDHVSLGDWVSPSGGPSRSTWLTFLLVALICGLSFCSVSLLLDAWRGKFEWRRHDDLPWRVVGTDNPFAATIGETLLMVVLVVVGVVIWGGATNRYGYGAEVLIPATLALAICLGLAVCLLVALYRRCIAHDQASG